MKIKRLVIENFKSIERIELIEPNPFTVFVGPNGSGKSNIFEALEFVVLRRDIPVETVVGLFGGKETIGRKQNKELLPKFFIDVETFNVTERGSIVKGKMLEYPDILTIGFREDSSYQQFKNFCHLFVANEKLVKLPVNDDQRLSLSAKNLEKVLKRVLAQPILKNEISEWLELFVPEFKGVEINDRDELHWFEEHSAEYFTKDLISDGTYNILAMLTAVYQSDDKPQFLCIEEPENGLHPQVAGELIDFFRIMCEERGHHIWLNTHSQSMIARLKPEEMVVVEKKQGKTQTTQYQGRDFHGLRMDEALLMNVLGGGLPW